MKTSRGFTLLELIITVTIMLTLISLVVPAFSRMLDSGRVKSVVSDIHIALVRARSEAFKRNQNIILAPNTTNDWKSGWTIATVTNPVTLDIHNAVSNLTITGPTNVTYRSFGRITGSTSVSFTIEGKYASSKRYICLDLSGRPSVSTVSCS